MSDDNKGGSDLDIFEGLGKKTAERSPAAPPPPPASSAHIAGRTDGIIEGKKTLVGMPVPPPGSSSSPLPLPAPPSTRPSGTGLPPSQPPPLSGSASPSRPPPPPPGRNTLPSVPPKQVSSAPGFTTQVSPQVPPPPQSTRPGVSPVSSPPSYANAHALPALTPLAPPVTSGAPATARNGTNLDMDWDDDDEATHVFDKDRHNIDEVEATELTGREPERANIDTIMSAPPRTSSIPSAPPAAGTPPPPPPASGPGGATLSGAFAALGQKTNGSTTPAQFRSGPPPSQSLRAAPPPPPTSARNPSTTTAPVPPPPPPGQSTTAPMHMPVAIPAPPAAPPTAHTMPSMQSPAQHQSQPPPHSQPPVQMPPVSRAMEATALVHRPQPSKAPLFIGLFVAVMAIAGLAVFFLMPRTGTLVVNVADNKGGAVNKIEVLVDGTKRCDSAPCIVRDVSTGVHEVKIVAQGYESAAPRAVTVDRKDVSTDFQLVASKPVGGTGFKVAGSQPGVKLNVDGKDIGPLPQELHDLEPGEHKLKFFGSERYSPQEKTVSVAKDEIVDLGNVQLKVVKGKATIELGTPGAKVYLVLGTNRKEVPQFPMGIEFNPNERWELQATKDGFEEFRQPITFDDGQAEKTFNVTLMPKGAAMAPVTHFTPGAQPAAQPVVAAAPKAPAATPAAAKEPVEKPEPTAKAEPAAKKDPAAPAAAGGGTEAFLNINSLPASTVLLDGKPLGPTPKLKVSVPPGEHTITFVNAEQALKKSITVKVGAGETKAAFAKLRAE